MFRMNLCRAGFVEDPPVANTSWIMKSSFSLFTLFFKHDPGSFELDFNLYS